MAAQRLPHRLSDSNSRSGFLTLSANSSFLKVASSPAIRVGRCGAEVQVPGQAGEAAHLAGPGVGPLQRLPVIKCTQSLRTNSRPGGRAAAKPHQNQNGCRDVCGGAGGCSEERRKLHRRGCQAGKGRCIILVCSEFMLNPKDNEPLVRIH